MTKTDIIQILAGFVGSSIFRKLGFGNETVPE